MRGAVEHITLGEEAGLDGSGTEPSARRTLQCSRILEWPEGAYTILSVLEGHYLGVHAVAAQGGARSYELDLRFADPAPVRQRNIPRAMLAIATGLTVLAIGVALFAWPAIVRTLGPAATAGLAALAIGAVNLPVLLGRTTESLQIRSATGGAALVSVTVLPQSVRHCESIFASLSCSIVAARKARPQEKPQFLRDSMREHHRLRRLGILSERQYELSKAAILAAH